MDKIIDVGFVKAVSRFQLASPDVHEFQFAVSDQSHDLVSRRTEPSSGFFQGQQRRHQRTPITVILSYLVVNRYSLQTPDLIARQGVHRDVPAAR